MVKVRSLLCEHLQELELKTRVKTINDSVKYVLDIRTGSHTIEAHTNILNANAIKIKQQM